MRGRITIISAAMVFFGLISINAQEPSALKTLKQNVESDIEFDLTTPAPSSVLSAKISSELANSPKFLKIQKFLENKKNAVKKKSSSFLYSPVPDPDVPGSFLCLNEDGDLGFNDIDMQELSETKIGYCGNFSGWSFPAGFDLNGADLRGAVFQQASVYRVKMNGADLRGSMFWAVDGYWVELKNALLTGAWIENTTFGYGKLQGIQMQYGAFRGVMLYAVDLSHAILDDIDMRGVTMYGDGATLEGTSMLRADLRNAYFRIDEGYGGMSETTNFTDVLLTGAFYNERSKFPFRGKEECDKRGMIFKAGDY